MTKRLVKLALFALPFFLAGCAASTGDPLQYTKKLVKEGHVSLYNNGAFQVPNTELTLIPAGPSALELAGELAGIRARESFVTAVQRAADSVTVVAEGTKKTYTLAGDIHQGTDRLADAIKAYGHTEGKLLIDRSSELGRGVIGESWQLSKDLFQRRKEVGEEIGGGMQQTGQAIGAAGVDAGMSLARQSLTTAGELSTAGRQRSKAAFSYAGTNFVRGYATMPTRMKERGGAIGDDLRSLNPLKIAKEQNRWREDLSQRSIDLLGDAVDNYGSNISASFRKAGEEIDRGKTDGGVTLAALKSLRWVVKGLLWDTVIEPTVKVTSAALGYLTVNFVAYPTMIVVQEGVATTNLAVELTKGTGGTAYDLVAPTAIAAVAGVYGALDFSGSHLAAGTTAVAGPTLGYGMAGASKVVGMTVTGVGHAAEKGVQYIGVPLASAGIAVGGGVVGTALVGTGAAAGGAVYVGGEAGSATTTVFGNLIAGTTLVGGTAASVATGAGLGVYELSKAVVVPTGYELGSGIVLGYGTASHLAAHSILAVSDAAYLVLSLEGPRWVLYAVTGKLGDGEDLPVGTVLDLKQMQASGEEFVNLPVSDAEMKAVVESVYDDLPVTPPQATTSAPL